MPPNNGTSGSALARTALHSLHLELGGKMVPFAGYDMPVQYRDGVLKEHLHTRQQAGLFDVSHMGQVRLTGPEAALALESLVPVDVVDLAVDHQRYALFTNEAGGILDDLMITNGGDHLFVVVNAACKDADISHMRRHLAGRCAIEELEGRGLLALQGPAAAKVLGRLAPAVRELVFMTAASVEIDGAHYFVTRSGYSGEDGYEISVPAERAEALARRLLAEPEVAPIGLGARDSLRLEAGLCLYGHDIDETTTPVEASLRWALSKARRADGARPGGYPGAQVILGQLAQGVARKRVGLRPDGRAPVREDTELVDSDGQTAGRVTSGGFGPSVGGPVAMGYVASAHGALGTQLQAVVRGRHLPVTVARMPFVEQRYYRG
jgi:aminomethyltransferase